MTNYFGYRSRMTRLVLDKMENDEYLNRIDRTEWYRLTDLHQLPFADKFVQMHEDAETKDFLEACFEKSESFFTQLFHSIVLSIFKWFMSITSINGLLHRGSMFVFSMQQFQTLIGAGPNPAAPVGGDVRKLESLLDLGAGDGMVTNRMAPFFENVYATEMSYTMQWRLRQKGFKVLDVEHWDKYSAGARISTPNDHAESERAGLLQDDQDLEGGGTDQQHLKFDVVSCLNLLDRCESPITLLRKIKNALKPGGLLVVALVLPFKPFVEYNYDNKPKEDLLSLMQMATSAASSTSASVESSQFSRATMATSFLTAPAAYSNVECNFTLNKINIQINFLVEKLFKPIGFELVKFTRLPYLCEGNLSQSYYYMYDYVFVLRKSPVQATEPTVL